ncbi:hypothetical protein FA15DRAFT_675549 [Coprinopsis marcescibilis]|uniref:Uncharacterized protein n=1 Tax=Coprinopsis marcescibilis TaxID=230819 RepID=A0A5C3KDF7_COPMA|nr:hypothetical protein FA15DRAFT_675549 [Coprinopsis marcescibilis]
MSLARDTGTSLSPHARSQKYVSLASEDGSHVRTNTLYTDSEPTLYSPSPASPATLRDSRHYKDTTYLIPGQGSRSPPPSKPRPPYEPLILNIILVFGTPLVMFSLGLAIEILAALSRSRGGFAIPRDKIPTIFGDVSAQFLVSFLPTFLVLPSALLWRELDWMLRSYQPFLTLFHGNASAEETVLLDYVKPSPLLALGRALKYKHRIIFVSSFTAVLTYLFVPLTGALLQIRPTAQIGAWSATRTETIGRAPDIANLQAFLAAAGYADYAVLQKIDVEPEFIRGPWATSKFTFPTDPLLNATLTVTTHGLRTNVNCSNPIAPPTLDFVGTPLVTITSRSINNCIANDTFSLNDGNDQSGVVRVPCPGAAADLEPQFQPIMFWFTHLRPGATELAVRTVFCAPIVTGTTAKVVSRVATGLIATMEKVSDEAPFNDVLNGANSGKFWNGLFFEPTTNNVIQARETAINLMVPTAIINRLEQRAQSIDEGFAQPNGVLDATSFVYTKYLTTAAKAIYFVPANATLEAEVNSIVSRLWVDPLPAHTLAAILLLTGIAGTILHLLNRRQRLKIPMSAQPGTIAATVALTSRSQWGQILSAQDDILTMEKKLEGMKFGMDQETGAIIAEDYGIDLAVPDREALEVRMSLMSKVSPQESSSFAAFQVAAGFKPWTASSSS